jgi:hypothetical protein
MTRMATTVVVVSLAVAVLALPAPVDAWGRGFHQFHHFHHFRPLPPVLFLSAASQRARLPTSCWAVPSPRWTPTRAPCRWRRHPCMRLLHLPTGTSAGAPEPTTRTCRAARSPGCPSPRSSVPADGRPALPGASRLASIRRGAKTTLAGSPGGRGSLGENVAPTCRAVGRKNHARGRTGVDFHDTAPCQDPSNGIFAMPAHVASPRPGPRDSVLQTAYPPPASRRIASHGGARAVPGVCPELRWGGPPARGRGP